jgi:transcriptional regulator EpsA
MRAAGPALVFDEDGALDGERRGPGPVQLDIRSLESLLLNLDAALQVHARKHFFTWTQGLLQSLMPHKVLICVLRCGDPPGFSADSFSTFVPDAAALGGLLLRDAAVVPALIRIWMDRGALPMICEAEEIGGILDGRFRKQLECIGATRLVLQGCQDADGEATALFVFACGSRTAGTNEAYLLQMLVPHLHAAWVRCQRNGSSADAGAASVSARAVSARERQVLNWIYRGKSNAEIAAILGISPLTVKNHVQHVLRKLNVVNRAQAVGKALDARIIGP